MGWFDSLRGTFSRKIPHVHADSPSGRTPIYSQFGRDIYASDVVVQATKCVTDEIRKLLPTHVISTGTDITPADGGDSLQRVLNNPNHYMNLSDFLGKAMYGYFQKCNSWIIPTYRTDSAGRRTYTGLYPVDPVRVDWIEAKSTGELYVKLIFSEKTELTLPYSDVIHLRRDYGANEYMGGGVDGLPDDRSLLKTLNINHDMLNGISKAMRTSQAVNGVIKYGSVMGKAETEAALKEFEEKLQNNASGILPMDMRGEYIPITRDIKMVDAATLKFIDEKILRNFGVPLDILTGDFDKATYEAFYQKTIEPLAIQLSQEFTRVLFTPGERSYGHAVKFYPKELVFMSVDQTIQMVTLLANTGALFENEKRAAFGMRPLKELEGKRYISLNWIDSTQANTYQTGKEGNGGSSDE